MEAAVSIPVRRSAHTRPGARHPLLAHGSADPVKSAAFRVAKGQGMNPIDSLSPPAPRREDG